DGGASWSPLNPQFGSPAFDPLHPGWIYGLVPGGVVGLSTDYGSTWSWFPAPPSPAFNTPSGITKLIPDPDQAGVLYAITDTIFGGKIFKTTSTASSWTALPP